MREQRCPECGYTKEDAQFHMDHKLCRNSGNAPWEKRADRNRAEPSPGPEAAPDEYQTAWASIEASCKIARGFAELKQELTRVAEDQNLRPHFFNRIGESNMCADCDFHWTDPIHLVGEPRMYQPPASEAQAPAVPDDLKERLAKAMMYSELERRSHRSLDEALAIPSETERTFRRMLVSGEVDTLIENLKRYGLYIAINALEHGERDGQ